MKKILVLFMLLGIFCFSTEGFKELKWGTSREKVIENLGTPLYNQGNVMKYKNIKFGNINLTELELKFENNKLTCWIGLGIEFKSDLDQLTNDLTEKYKGFELTSENENSEIDRLLERYNVTTYLYDGKGSILLFYWDSSPNRVSKLKYFRIEYDSLTSKERLSKMVRDNKSDL